MTYLGEGTWINSCLVGANSYKVLSSEETYRSSPLEERTDDWPRLDEQHYAVVASNWDHHKLWMVFYPVQGKNVSELAEVIERVQAAGMYQDGFFWPFDLVQLGGVAGYLIRPIDTVRYRPVRGFLGDTKAERWDIAISMFRRIQALHSAGFTMNGFSRDQIRVDVETNQVCIWPDGDSTRISCLPAQVRRNDYLSIPARAEEEMVQWGNTVSGALRDVFSGAVLAFYLLFFTHPFVGSAYWPLMREDYWIQYMHQPSYIFDPAGENRLGYLDFEQEIQELWKKTSPELRGMFDNLFLEVTHPGEAGDDRLRQAMDIPRWICLLEADAAANGAPEQRTRFPFEMMNNYQV